MADEPICECGHRQYSHLDENEAGERICWLCDCRNFTPKKQTPPNRIAGKIDPPRTTPSGLSVEEIIADLTLVNTAEEAVKAYVYGRLIRVRGSHYDVELTKGNETKEVTLLQAVAKYELASPDTALISLPVGFVAALGIESFVLDEDEVERRRQHVAEYGALHISKTTKQPAAEKVGGVRI